VKERCND